MWKKIKNPKTGKFISIFGKKGKTLLKHYTKITSNNHKKSIQQSGGGFNKYYEKPKPIQTHLSPTSRTILIGDIHGDYQVLLYCLIYVAEVVQYTKNQYKWIGKDTRVVFIGDLIDRHREGITLVVPHPKTGIELGYGGEFEHEEMIIHKLLTNLNNQACSSGGEIIRLVGNHELMRFDHDSMINSLNYIAPGLRNPEAIMSKNEFLKKSYLSRTSHMRMIVKIGNWIAVHGGLILGTLKQMERLNFGIQDPLEKLNILVNLKYNDFYRTDNKSYLDIANKFTFSDYETNSDDPVWNRTFGWFMSESARKQRCSSHDHLSLNSLFRELHSINASRYSKTELKLAIAHCSQEEGGNGYHGNANFKTIFYKKQATKGSKHVYAQKIVKCYNELVPNSSKNPAGCSVNGGINMDCLDENNDPRIFRLDAAMSRGFDNFNRVREFGSSKRKIMAYWKAKRPQVLEILHGSDNQDQVRILISKYHVPRYDYLRYYVNVTGSKNKPLLKLLPLKKMEGRVFPIFK